MAKKVDDGMSLDQGAAVDHEFGDPNTVETPKVGTSVKLPDGREARHKTFREMLETVLARVETNKKNGNYTQYDRDMEMIVSVLLGASLDDDHPSEVVLTDEQSKRDEISELEAKLARAKAR